MLVIIFFLLTSLFCCSYLQGPVPTQMTQFPSPMVENVRTHERFPDEAVPGSIIILDNVFAKPVEIYVPERGKNTSFSSLLIHFHGLSYIPMYAVYHSDENLILTSVNLGFGSSVYERTFNNPDTFDMLISSIQESVIKRGFNQQEFKNIYISSFSAGYGAVRAILKNRQSRVNGLILLDGLHTDYVPKGRVLHDGGILNEEKLQVFRRFALLAVKGQKKFLITHSEIFPGTYASTTETADYIIHSLGLSRIPALKWEPVGMQLISETTVNGLTVLGFAGNTAPDHIDHLHGLPVFLEMMLDNNEQ